MTGPHAPHRAADAVSETFDVAQAAARTVADHLGRHTYRWTTEHDLQQGIGAVLAQGFEHCRAEAAISPKDRPDFLVYAEDCTVAVEVKVRGSFALILRQLGRYAQHDRVDALVLAAGRRTLLPGMPTTLLGKPVISVLTRAPLR